ncbi:Extra-large guanine nucleotide-binding protein like [Actinidia chinensis var. chinensis]|uniref:Extra-large guanine nucleotide-binding protein like n=1 Tax=Actinidia chinensis var. chinensis TaxID=1590841 RepID=A0A2R6QIY0_ACTCC|nr:Extra-large guanine nucleotide-binding protein like [Actinidia chinensis var. chinensis]
MEELESKVRLVRCPKCKNLLPELPHFSVYQCGGCGTVLRAKKKGPVSDHSSEKSDDERGRGGPEKGLGVSLENASESISEGLERCRKKEEIFSERTVNLTNSSSSGMENREFANNFDQHTRRETMNLRVDQSNEDGEGGYFSDRYTQGSQCSFNNWVNGNDHEANTDLKRSESGNSFMENEVKEIKPPNGNFAGSLRSRPIMDEWSAERNGLMAFGGSGRSAAERRRFSNFPYPDEGPSNYWPGSFNGYAEHKRIRHDMDGPSRVENLEHDRAELLRKLDELKDQLSRSCDVTEKPKEMVPRDRMTAPPPPPPAPNHYNGHGFYVPEDPTNLYTVDFQPETLYCNHNNVPVRFVNSHAFNMQDFYPPPRNVPNEVLEYKQSHLPQRLMRPPHQPPPQYLKQPFRGHFTRQDMDFNRSTIVPDWNGTFLHQPACSCLECYKNCKSPPKVPHPTVSGRSPTDPANRTFRRYVSSVTCGPHSRGASSPHLHPLTRQHQKRSSSDFDLDAGGFGLRRPRRVVVAHGSERFCHPIAGGSPFLTCYSCFEVLKLPRKLTVTRKNQQKVRCGACYAIILIEFEKKGIVVSVPTKLETVLPQDDDGSGEMLNEDFQSFHHRLNTGATNSCSDDYDNSGYDFQLTDSEPNVLSSDQRLDFGESHERQELLSSSSSFSEDQSPDSVISQREVSNSADKPSEDDVPHQKDPDRRYGTGNKSKRHGQEKLILDNSSSRQNSVKDVSVATEMEVSCNEGVAQDMAEVSKDDRPRINKGSESFFASLIRRSFREFSRSSHSAGKRRSNVFVNGQPLSDRIVKKAEKKAGPIQPGNYWYDYRAGFWGLMGQPCAGIIPPFIEEFNYPMPENCAAGNTGVFVNGRELHQKDLELLAGRGLPTARDKSYVIEISGRILDEDTGEELDCLGKLAPTVERAQHGFGMKVPRLPAE